jgi:hypothetical protein
MSCPLKKSWKFRWRKARKVAGNPTLVATEPFRPRSSESAVVGGLLKAESSTVRMTVLYLSIQSGRHDARPPLSPQFGTSQMAQEAVKSERPQPVSVQYRGMSRFRFVEIMMSTDQVHIERRAAQRFDFQLSVSVRLAGSDRAGCGFTQNLCARGALFHTDLPLSEADAIELTLVMPSEITLAENMRVRCRGKVLRVLSSAMDSRSVVAVHLEGYEFLPEAAAGSSDIARVSGLHEHPHGDETGTNQHARPARSSLRP